MAEMKRAANALAYALGVQQPNGFHVRRVVWGRLMADAERRPHEEIRRAVIMVAPNKKAAPKSEGAAQMSGVD